MRIGHRRKSTTLAAPSGASTKSVIGKPKRSREESKSVKVQWEIKMHRPRTHLTSLKEVGFAGSVRTTISKDGYSAIGAKRRRRARTRMVSPSICSANKRMVKARLAMPAARLKIILRTSKDVRVRKRLKA